MFQELELNSVLLCNDLTKVEINQTVRPPTLEFVPSVFLGVCQKRMHGGAHKVQLLGGKFTGRVNFAVLSL